MIHDRSKISEIIGDTIDNARLEDHRRISRQAVDFFYGRQLVHMDKVFSKIFANWDDDSRDRIPLRVIPLLQKVIKTRSLLFKKPPTFTIVDSNEESLDDITEDYNRIIDDAQKTIRLRTLDQLTRATTTTVLQAIWHNADNRLIYRIHTVNEIGVVHDVIDPSRPTAALYKTTALDLRGEEVEHTVYWDDEHTYKIDENGEIIENQNNAKFVNPYGLLPFVEFRNFDHFGNEFWMPIDETGVNVNESINVLLTDLLHIAKEQGFAQPYITGVSNTKDVFRDPTTFIDLPADAEMGFAQPDAPITELYETIENIINLYLSLVDLSGSQISTGLSNLSGIAVYLLKSDLYEDREERRGRFENGLQRLFDIEKAVLNYHRQFVDEPWLEIPQDAKLHIDWPEIKPAMTTDEKIAIDEHRLKYNLDTPAKILMRENPDIGSEDQAQDIIRDNKTYNRSLTDRLSIPEFSTAGVNAEGGDLNE